MIKNVITSQDNLTIVVLKNFINDIPEVIFALY